jgi:ubiquinone biosynthesis protein
VCEPYFTRPLSEISLGEVVFKLFRTAQRYELTLQPQLILLQKTLLNIEGVGRDLYPKINIWEVAKPELEAIYAERYGLPRTAERIRRHSLHRAARWTARARPAPRTGRWRGWRSTTELVRSPTSRLNGP